MPPRPWPVDEFCQLSRAPMFLSRRLFFTASSGIAGLIPDRPRARWHSCGRSGSPTPSFAAWAGRAASRGRSRDPFGVPSRAAGEPAAPGSGALLPLPESPAAVGVGISDLPMPFVGEGYALQAPDAPLQVQSDNGTLVHGRRPSYADDLAGGISQAGKQEAPIRVLVGTRCAPAPGTDMVAVSPRIERRSLWRRLFGRVKPVACPNAALPPRRTRPGRRVPAQASSTATAAGSPCRTGSHSCHRTAPGSPAGTRTGPGTGGVGKQENTSMPVIWTGRQTRTRGSRLTITCRPVWYRPQHEPGMAD